MSSESFGDISLADYRRIGGRRRIPRWALVVAALVLCGTFTAAGAYSGLWDGQDSQDLDFAKGMHLLSHPDAEAYQLEGGLNSVYAEMVRGIDKYEEYGKRSDTVGKQARTYLLNLAIRAVKKLEAVTATPDEQALVDRQLPRRSKPAVEDETRPPK